MVPRNSAGQLRPSLFVLFFLFPSMMFALLLSLPHIIRDSDPGSRIAGSLSSPLPTTAWSFVFIGRRLQPLLSSPVESRLVRALSTFTPSIYLSCTNLLVGMVAGGGVYLWHSSLRACMHVFRVRSVRYASSCTTCHTGYYGGP